MSFIRIVSRHPVLVLASLALLSGLLVTVGLYRAWAAPVDAPRLVTDAGDDALRITWVGDIMLGDRAQELLDLHGYEWPLVHLDGVLDGDVVVANLEAPITERTEPFDPFQHWHYNSDPRAAAAYAAAGIDIVGLANNHAMDRGPQGVADTFDHLDAAGIRWFGAGKDISQAELPMLVETPTGTVGIVGFGQYYDVRKMAKADQAGTIATSVGAIERGRDLARRAGADWIVAFVHWGENYAGITPEQRAQARQFVEAGYDIVIGHHPHVAQEIELVDGVPIVYSLGNYVFNAPGRFDEGMPGYGLVVTSEFSSEGVRTLEVKCLLTDNTRVDYQPRPCPRDEAATVLTDLHPDVSFDGERGLLELHPAD